MVYYTVAQRQLHRRAMVSQPGQPSSRPTSHLRCCHVEERQLPNKQIFSQI